jgi:hypothetical protein
LSAYGYTLASLTQIDAEDVPRWVERGERDLDSDGLVRGRETDAVIPLTATVGGRKVHLTVYKQHGRVRLEAEGLDPRALERYLCDQLELTVVSQVERALPRGAAPQVENGGTQQQALMEMFRALGAPHRAARSKEWWRGNGSSEGNGGLGDWGSYNP